MVDGTVVDVFGAVVLLLAGGAVVTGGAVVDDEPVEPVVGELAVDVVVPELWEQQWYVDDPRFVPLIVPPSSIV